MQMATRKLMNSDVAAEPAGAQEIVRWISLVSLTIRNWFISWTFFLPSFLITLISMVTSAVIYYLMGQTVSRGAQPYISEYGFSYGSYIVTGVMFVSVMEATLGAYHETLLRGYWTNQFDVYLQHPGGVSALLVGELFARYLVNCVNTLVYLLVAVWLFGISFHIANLFDTIVVLLLAVVSLTGLGLAGASTFSLFNAKREETNPVKLFVTLGATLLSGVYFPPAILPHWLQMVGDWLPQTHILRAARLCLGARATIGDPLIANDISYLLKFTLLTLPLGIWLFALGMRRMQREGGLTRWS